MRRWIFHVVILTATIVTAHGTTSCAHDEEPGHTSGGVRDTGYFFNRRVPYADAPAHGRALQSSSFDAIRIHLHYVPGATAALTTVQDDFLRNTLMPAALSWITQSLAVVPVSGMLKYERWCGSSFSSGQCASLGSSSCGIVSDGSAYSVPDSFLGSLTTCSTCYTNGQCTDCTTHPDGAGLAADYVLFVSAVNTGTCSGATVAYASACQRDQNDRPIFGQVCAMTAVLTAALLRTWRE